MCVRVEGGPGNGAWQRKLVVLQGGGHQTEKEENKHYIPFCTSVIRMELVCWNGDFMADYVFGHDTVFSRDFLER